MLPERNKVLKGDCIPLMQAMPGGVVDLVFADPPFNIGLNYDVYKDKLPYDQYYSWSARWIEECVRILKPDGSMYVAIGDEFASEVNVILKTAGLKFRNWICWYYTFGQNQRLKFNRCHTHILYFVKDSDSYTFNASDVLVPSARQLKYNDKRAKSGGKIPDDVWMVHAEDDVPVHELRLWPEDAQLWNDSRVCGTFKERLRRADGSAHPCQMPLSVLRRIIRASSSKGQLVLDPFCGTGTTAYAAKELGRDYLTMELSEEYFNVATDRLTPLANAA
jgi:DNA modification methylase